MKLRVVYLLLFSVVSGINSNEIAPKLCDVLFNNRLDCPRPVIIEHNLVCFVNNHSFPTGKENRLKYPTEAHISDCRKWSSVRLTTHLGQKCIKLEFSPLFDDDTSCSTDLQPVEYNPDVTLHQACEKGKLDMVKYILCNGLTDINSVGKSGFTPVMAAASKGELAVFDFLVSEECDLSLLDNRNHNVLNIACMGGNVEIVRKLIERHKLNLENCGRSGNTPVLHAVFSGHIGVYDLLVRKGCNLGAVNMYDKNVLHAACFVGDVNMVEHLLKQKIFDINSRAMKDRTPVMMAARKGHVGVIKLLVEDGCDIKAVDNKGNTVLHFACHAGHVDVLKYLISHKAVDMEMWRVKNKHGKTPGESAGKHKASSVICHPLEAR